MSYSDRIFNFVAACVAECPAEHYMLVLNGHGSGVYGGLLAKENGDEIESLTAINLGKLMRGLTWLYSITTYRYSRYRHLRDGDERSCLYDPQPR